MDRLLNIIKRIIPKRLFKFLQPAYHYILSWFSAAAYCFPSEKLIVVGVTGTTGKTTSVYLIARALTAAGYKVGYTSTAVFNDGEKEWLNDKKMTMVGRFFTQKILHQMVRNGCHYAVIETTSEGIVQFRHRFINYDTLIFTGLYPEHIESHGGFENYKKAKGRLFAHLKNCKVKYVDDKKIITKADNGMKKIELNRVKKTIIANVDDREANYFLSFWAEEKYVYGGKEAARLKGRAVFVKYDNVKTEKGGINFRVNGIKINLNFLGEFNAANAMTAVSLGLSQGIDLKMIKKGLESVEGIPGRLELINEGQPFTVIVDYAFEPGAIAKLYEIIYSLPRNKIIHVLGSTGGGRDVARRPRLGKLAGEKADFVIVTNEDPYDDNPWAIINQVAHGAEKTGKKLDETLFKILDRGEAIKKALLLAQDDDVVLITGKGCEQAICVAGGRKIPWDDRKVVRTELKLMK